MKKIFLVFLFLVVSCNAFSQTNGYKLTLIASGISQPIGIENCGDDRLFIVQQNGYIKIVQNGLVLAQPFLNIDALTNGNIGSEQGLLGLAFSPDYQNNGFIFINYTNVNGNTVIARYQVSPTNPDSIMPSSAAILLTIVQPFVNHNGGCVLFDPQGYLLIGMGDGGNYGDIPYNNAQNTLVLLGKILRIDVSDTSVAYGIPPSNPFVGNVAYAPEIWDYGIRNPWRITYDRLTNDLWIGDVQQNLYEEINMEPAGNPGGNNYGWRCYEGNHAYNTNGCGPMSNYTFPVIEYGHSGSKCSVTGGYVYRGPSSPRLWGRYIYADYCESKIHFVSKNSSGAYVDSVLMTTPFNSITSFGEDVCGEIYVCDYNNNKIHRLDDTLSHTPAGFISDLDTISVCGNLSTTYLPGVTYQWFLNGNLIPSSDSCTINISQSGNYSVVVNSVSFCTSYSDSVYAIFFAAASAPTINNLDTVYCIGDPAVTLSGSPANGLFTIDGNPATVFDATAAGLGMHVVNYSYIDSNGCEGITNQNVLVDACSGIAEASDQSFQIIPNPNNGKFLIRFDKIIMGDAKIQLIDNIGRKVFEKSYSVHSSVLEIEANGLPESFYQLLIYVNNKMYSKKIMITR